MDADPSQRTPGALRDRAMRSDDTTEINAAAPATAADREALLAIQPIGPLQIHGVALPAQQHMEPPVAEAPTLRGQRTEPLTQLRPVRSAWLIATGRAAQPDQRAS